MESRNSTISATEKPYNPALNWRKYCEHIFSNSGSGLQYTFGFGFGFYKPVSTDPFAIPANTILNHNSLFHTEVEVVMSSKFKLIVE